MNPADPSTLRKSHRSFAAIFVLLLCALLSFTLTAASAADEHTAAGHAAAGASHEAAEHHGLPTAAPTFGGSIVNSSMIVTWVVAA
ncbi:MAG: hypothetical protein ABI318_05375, partial [Chthoniobacteraceae bacterium]